MPPARHLRAWVVAGVCLLFAASSEAALVVKAWKPPGAARFILACVADAVIDLPTCATVNDGFDCRVLATDALYLCNGGSWAAVGGGGGGVSDGDKGDITVSGSGAMWTIDADSVALINLPSPGIRIYPGTCIWMVLRGTATAASVSGSYTIMER